MDRYAFDVAKSKCTRSINLKGPCYRRVRWSSRGVLTHVEGTKICVTNEGNHSRILGARALDGANEAQGMHERNVLSSIEKFVQANG
jgi:hypothetical protein